jgi:hypothetical protein
VEGQIFVGACALLLAFSLRGFVRARRGSADRHFMKIQALLASGMLFGSLDRAFALQGVILTVGTRVVGVALLLATWVYLARTKRVRQNWR